MIIENNRIAVVSRRGFLVTGTALAASWRAMPSTPACVLNAEQEEGPYYVEDEKVRRDITEGKKGIPLRLRMLLIDSKRCTPVPNAALDIWHCDAQGVYSGFTAMKGGPGGPFGGPGGGPPPGPPPDDFGPPPPMRGGNRTVDATRFLRGVQVTDKGGFVEFATIYPGWYQGRAIHIHMKVHTGGHVAHTGQLFFPEEITERVAKMHPYVNHKDVHRTTQSEDDVFESQHGAEGLVTLSRLDPKSEAAGFLATVTLAVDPEANPNPVEMRGPGFRRTRV